MGNNDRRPKIRFKGFNDDWEQHKLGNLGYTYTGLSGKTKNDFGHGDGKFITYINVFSNTIADCNLVESVEIDKKQNKVEYGDILFTTSSETPKEVGMSSVYLGNEDNIYLNSFCFGFKPTYKFDNYYIAYILRSVYVRKKIIPLAQGISRYNISKSKMMEIQINLPCMIEQKKIGEFFKQLDNDITLHQRKLEKLGNIKKSMLEKMFPKDENKVPEIRFKGFNDDWEQHKLGEICNSFEYGLNAASKEYDGKNKYIRITDINDETREFSKEDLTSPDIDLKNLDSYKLKKGDIVFARTGASVGKTYLYNEKDEVVYYAGFLIRAQIKNQYSNEFIFQNTLTKKYIDFIYIMSQRSGQPGINSKEYASFELKVPNLEEQNKIGSFLNNIDNLISLHQRKLEKLKNIKKACLEKMFV